MSRYTDNNALAKWWDRYDSMIGLYHMAREQDTSVTALLANYDRAIFDLQQQLAKFIAIDNNIIDDITGVDLNG